MAVHWSAGHVAISIGENVDLDPEVTVDLTVHQARQLQLMLAKAIVKAELGTL